VLTVLLLWLMLAFTSLGVWALILSSGIAMSVYVYWKWTYEVIKSINLTWRDISQTLKTMWEENKLYLKSKILNFKL
jgi:O-antigen/teichoic acid export membrane protein